MKKNLITLLPILLFFNFNNLYSQENLEENDSISSNKVENKPLLLDNIKYDASDSITIDQLNNKITLYNNAKIIFCPEENTKPFDRNYATINT